MSHLRAFLMAIVALPWIACDRPPGPSERASGATTTATAPTSAPGRDDTPPTWPPPPEYTELAWSAAAAMIRSGGASRLIGTTTRRAYLIAAESEKHFTVEPNRGDLKAAYEGAPNKDNLIFREGFEEIPWSDAVAHLREHRAISVTAGHFGLVTLTLTNKALLFTVAPRGADFGDFAKEASAPGSALSFTVE